MFSIYFKLFWTAFTANLASIKDFKNMWSYPDSHPVGRYLILIFYLRSINPIVNTISRI